MEMHPILILSFLTTLPAPKLDPELRAKVEARIAIARLWAADPVVVEAVRDANESPRSMEEIAALDARWRASTGVDAFIRSFLDRPTSERLRELRASHPELQEAFVTDRLGANVALTNKTSDFYQGDEDKFREAFADGKGGTHMGELKRDESIQSYSVQIGVPVLDEGAAIGVLVVTVNVEKLKKMN
jgi:hypothetical protein